MEDFLLVASSRGRQSWGVSGGMGQPVSPLLLPWVLLSLCNGSPLVGLSREAAGKCQGIVGNRWLSLAVSAQLSPSGNLSPALSDRRGF